MADFIKKFRPIALINVAFRLLVKGIATRLSLVANQVIDPSQSAFIRGRSILEGILVLHEVQHSAQFKKENVFILKLDFEKAYDCVSWEFLEGVIYRKGFDPLWVSWIMQLLRGEQTAININGEPDPFSQNLRGVRQGGPISLLLFNLVVDALAIILRVLRQPSIFVGCSLKSAREATCSIRTIPSS